MVRYTKDDMRKLRDMSVEGSPARVFTEEAGFSPSSFRSILESYGLKKDVHYLFELPLEEVGLLINKGEVSGYLKFRCEVGK